MKRYGYLYNDITDFQNLYRAARNAQRGKRFKKSTAAFNLRLETELIALQRELRERSYVHGGYKSFFVHDPKRRLISAAPYRDRVVHHALCNIITPIFEKTFIEDSYACRKGKGNHKAADKYTEYAQKFEYVLKCDIRKYFPCIDHEILFSLISRKIKCPDTLWLIRSILDSWRDARYFEYFPGDDLFTPCERRKGIPIGNLTSQFFANIYLNGFDHYMKEDLRVKGYVRYVDDFVVFDNDKRRLNEIRRKTEDYLSALRLSLHEKKCRIYRVDEGIEFLGYRIFPTHRLLKKQNVLHMRRKLRKLQKQYKQGTIDPDGVKQVIMSWIGHAKHANTWKLRECMLSGVVFQRGGVESV